MCIILVANKKHLSREMIENSFENNPDGCGIAWPTGSHVHFEKGMMTVDRMLELCDRAPLPHIAHFRIATQGGVRPELCHPFPVTRDVPLILEGDIDGPVLFHNGNWSSWRDNIIDKLGRVDYEGHPISNVPNGKWSDTRAMAWMAAHFGKSVLELIDEKAVVLGPNGELDAYGNGWLHAIEKIDGEPWFWASNSTYERRKYTSGYMGGSYGTGYKSTMCHYVSCAKTDINKDGWCKEHDPRRFEKDRDKHSKERGNDVVKLLPPANSNGNNGGTSTDDLPFAEVMRLWREGKVSKNKMKQARKRFEKDCKRAQELSGTPNYWAATTH